jgi:glutathione S-transferase
MDRDVGARQFCHGNAFSLADIAVGFAMGYLDYVLPEVRWRTSCPSLKALYERLASRHSFRTTAPPPR